MKKLSRSAYFLTALIALGFASGGKATTISFESILPLQPTDITDYPVSMTPFIPGTNSIPVNAVLRSYAIKYEEEVTGSVSVTLSTGSTQTVAGTAQTYGAIFLFYPTPAADLQSGHINTMPPPADDVFGGNGPNVSKTVYATLSAGGSSKPVSYDITASATSGEMTSDLARVQSDWTAYVDSGTTKTITLTSGSSGDVIYTNQVGGKVTVTYTYDLIDTPEPTTTAMIGGVLISIAMLRKRLARRRS